MPYGTVNADVIGTSVANSNLGAGNATRFKNRIINGDMRIDQRYAGGAISAATLGSSGYTVDRWAYAATQSAKFSAQQNQGSVTPPTGFRNYLGFTSSSAYSVVASDVFYFNQRIEGFNFADMAWGTANAKTVTLSFWVYSSLTGTFGGSLNNSAGNRYYPFSYTVSSANTWTLATVTIAGDTSGTWVGATNGIGVQVNFGLGAGSTYSGTSGVWASSVYLQPTGTVSVVGTSGATFYITGVQLEVGSSATGFEYVDQTTQLAMCQRYYYKQGGATSYGRFGSGFVGAGSSTSFYATVVFPVTMRAKPTSIDWTGSMGVWNGGGIASVSAISLESGSEMPNSAVALSTSSGLTAQAPYTLMGNASGTAALAFSAEL
jgi:hypothetical protein